ncbi:MAG: peptidylprolyl isomerase, partial [Clostridia bacterium]
MYTETTEATDFVKIEMTSGDSIVVKLDGAVAPLTVENFKKLVGEGFFNGLIFHRVISGFMVQGGDPTGTGMGGSSQTIKGEFAKNGVANTL